MDQQITHLNQQLVGKIIDTDCFNNWSDKSKDIPFKTTKKAVGNGEEKLAKELDILTGVGGQNNIIDLVHPILGNISVKDMTNTDCTLGTKGCQSMRIIFRTVINLFVCWVLKYKSQCELAGKFHDRINQRYGSSKTTILEGIDRHELSKTNLSELNSLVNDLQECKLSSEIKYSSLTSEYVDDIVDNLGGKSLQELLDNCAQKEAVDMTLIVVDENKGWCVVKDIGKISCPRITRGAPRINYS